VGAGGQAASDIDQVSSENIVALCDVDEARCADVYKKYPDARKYKDFRVMLEKEAKHIDAVGVTIPDHGHAVAAAMAIKMGKDVYCQKPLTHSIAEAQTLLELSRKHKVVTQMGIQGHPSYARTVEFIRAGAIGTVREVHVMTDRPIWPQGMAAAPVGSPPVPATLDWDQWIGPQEMIPYNPAYLPFVWRGWWEFGTGSLGDMGCHLIDGPFWSLNLDAPTSVEAQSEGLSAVAAPSKSIVHYEFPARGDRAAVKLTWYDAGQRPDMAALNMDPNLTPPGFNGSLFIGDNGMLLVSHGGGPVLFPLDKFKGYQRPPESIKLHPGGHYREWIDACKARDMSMTGAGFEYAVPLTKTVLLGNVAIRCGQRLEWDSRGMKVTNCPQAHDMVHYRFRKGWRL
jgi:predicted dehydrogenase